MMNFTAFATKVADDPRLSELIARYDNNPLSLSDEELSEMVDRSMDDDDEFDPEDGSPEDDFYEDWDNLEMGFDPYMGCYSDDC